VSFHPRLPRDDVNVPARHPLVEASWLVAGAAVVGLLLAALAFAATEFASRWLPPALEARVFGRLFDDWGAAPSAHPREPAAAALLARLASRWPENPYAFRLFVADQGTPNAFALPGGAIAVTSGLLDAVESENELAFVLAHEIGHFAARDHLRAIGRGLILQLGLRAVVGAGAGDAVPGLASEIASRGFSRDQERDADRFALALVAAEYGHVAGADAFFRRLPDAEAGLATRAAAWFSTHPVSESRIDALRASAAREGYRSEGPLTPLPIAEGAPG
jgi:Zn-dependent protease with chaperone function